MESESVGSGSWGSLREFTTTASRVTPADKIYRLAEAYCDGDDFTGYVYLGEELARHQCSINSGCNGVTCAVGAWNNGYCKLKSTVYSAANVRRVRALELLGQSIAGACAGLEVVPTVAGPGVVTLRQSAQKSPSVPGSSPAPLGELKATKCNECKYCIMQRNAITAKCNECKYCIMQRNAITHKMQKMQILHNATKCNHAQNAENANIA